MNKKGKILSSSFLGIGILLCLMLYPDRATSGPYLNSTHGNSSYGVNRTSISTFGYSTGNCAHCHEQHAMIGGGEPSPSGGPDIYALFYTNHVDQTDNFCFHCHTDTTDLNYLQAGVIKNRSYSYRAGGYTSDTLDDILEAFSFTSPSSSHDLDNILTFITGESWGYTSDSNPCAACHNPHRGQGDPANAPNNAKTSLTRGWPVSLPSQHSTDNNAWGLWGDDTSEKMSDYASGFRYQAPYRNGSTSAYEPDGSTTQDGSNLTDYATFCQDCHSNSMTGLSNTPIDWATSAGDKHGKRAADETSGNYIDIDNPYSNTYGGQYVLSCTDCHEPHGAPNLMLIRQEVNGGTLSPITTIDAPTAECPDATVSGNKELGFLCQRCHWDDADAAVGAANRWCYVHHESTDSPYSLSSCGDCHTGGMSFTPETPILMSDGTHKPIGEIKASDKVLSFDFDNNTTSESEVIEVSKEFVNETLEINGVKTTFGHLFAVGRDKWVEAGKLETGDTILRLAEHGNDLEKIKLEKPMLTRHPEKVEVVNITLKSTQNFFVVGKENKFLVHNMGGMSCSDDRDPINCNCCHFHGSDDSAAPSGDRTGRRTF